MVKSGKKWQKVGKRRLRGCERHARERAKKERAGQRGDDLERDSHAGRCWSRRWRGRLSCSYNYATVPKPKSSTGHYQRQRKTESWPTSKQLPCSAERTTSQLGVQLGVQLAFSWDSARLAASPAHTPVHIPQPQSYFTHIGNNGRNCLHNFSRCKL